MRKIIYLFILPILYSGCSVTNKKLIGTYKSTCILQAYPDVILELDSNNSFSYKFANQNNRIVGSWTRKADTIYLFSKDFNTDVSDPLAPIQKYTTLSKKDGYIIKKNKLLLLNKDGVTEKCFLQKY